MSDLYRDAPDCSDTLDGNHVWTFDSDCLECGAETRPVVEIEPCEHGKIDEHQITDGQHNLWTNMSCMSKATLHRCDKCWCPGVFTKEKESCGCEAEHLGPDGYGCKLNRTGIGEGNNDN